MKNLRIYGEKPYKIAVIHGGPGAPGEMAPVARELASIAGILEPLQTEKSITGQVGELHAVLKENADLPVILIGWSWGAWLSFIFTAQHPSFIKKLILIDSGSFDKRYAVDIMKTRLSRLGEEDRAEVLSLMATLNDPAGKDKNKLTARLGELIFKADSYDPLPHESEALEYQHDVYRSVQKEASEMRSRGKLLELGKKITCPVVAIHGDYDPHLAEGVREPLSRVLKDFRFILLENCGHHPWFERAARDKFYMTLKSEII